MGPEPDPFIAADDIVAGAAPETRISVSGPLGSDIAHPPKRLPV